MPKPTAKTPFDTSDWEYEISGKPCTEEQEKELLSLEEKHGRVVTKVVISDNTKGFKSTFTQTQKNKWHMLFVRLVVTNNFDTLHTQAHKVTITEAMRRKAELYFPATGCDHSILSAMRKGKQLIIEFKKVD